MPQHLLELFCELDNYPERSAILFHAIDDQILLKKIL